MGGQSHTRLLILGLLLAANGSAADAPGFLRASLGAIQPKADDLTRNARWCTYKPVFGIGGAGGDRLITVVRYGELTVGAGGASARVSYPSEEQIYYVLEGAATLLYGDEQFPVKRDDFLYLPPGLPHGIRNQSDASARVMVMGFRMPEETAIPPAPRLMLANADEVPLQILGQHGPTSQFKLLMGTTRSRRDKLAAAQVMSSLFLMDFAPGGTNIPHSHPREEEIYFVLRGSGEIVAGVDAAGNDLRHPVRQGDVFCFLPNTRLGFYSGAREGGPHDLILAVRAFLPRTPGNPR
jgi:mannose-6-phosphate isomerase-like protein (cupin superfamily)